MRLIFEKIDKSAIQKQLALQDGSQIVMLSMDYFDSQRCENLLRFDSGGSEEWRSMPPGSPDAFADFWREDNRLFAYAWSGFRCEVALDTGKILSADFTK